MRRGSMSSKSNQRFFLQWDLLEELISCHAHLRRLSSLKFMSFSTPRREELEFESLSLDDTDYARRGGIVTDEEARRGLEGWVTLTDRLNKSGEGSVSEVSNLMKECPYLKCVVDFGPGTVWTDALHCYYRRRTGQDVLCRWKIGRFAQGD